MTYWLGLPGTAQVIAPRACYKRKKIAEYTEPAKNLGVWVPEVCKNNDFRYFKTLCALRRMCFNKIFVSSEEADIKLALYAGWDLSDMMISLDDDDIFTARTYFVKDGNEVWFRSSYKCGFVYAGPNLGFVLFSPPLPTNPDDFVDAQDAEDYFHNLVQLAETLEQRWEDIIASHPDESAWMHRQMLLNVKDDLLQQSAATDRRFQEMTISFGKPNDHDLCKCIKEHLVHDFFKSIDKVRKAVNDEITRPEFPFKDYPCARTAPVKSEPLHALYYDEPQNKVLCKAHPDLCHLWLRCFYESLKGQRLRENKFISSKEHDTTFIIGNYDGWGDHRPDWAGYADLVFNTSYDNIPGKWDGLYDDEETKYKVDGSWISLFENMSDLDRLFKYANSHNWHELWVFPGSDKRWEEQKRELVYDDEEACEGFLARCEFLCSYAKLNGWSDESGRLVERYAYQYCIHYPRCEECESTDPDDWTDKRPEGFPPIESDPPPSGGIDDGFYDSFFGPRGLSNR